MGIELRAASDQRRRALSGSYEHTRTMLSFAGMLSQGPARFHMLEEDDAFPAVFCCAGAYFDAHFA